MAPHTPGLCGESRHADVDFATRSVRPGGEEETLRPRRRGCGRCADSEGDSVTARATLSMSPSAYARIGRWYRRGLARRLLVGPVCGNVPREQAILERNGTEERPRLGDGRRCRCCSACCGRCTSRMWRCRSVREGELPYTPCPRRQGLRFLKRASEAGGLVPEPLTERLKQFDKAQRVARTAVADLSSVKPPGDAVQDTAVLVKAMRLLIGGSDQIWEDVLHGNSFGAKRASLSLKRAPVFRAAAVAVRDLKAKGYFGNG